MILARGFSVMLALETKWGQRAEGGTERVCLLEIETEASEAGVTVSGVVGERKGGWLGVTIYV